MQYVILFLEGVITFISPCLLPIIPVYISYFAGGGLEHTTKKTVYNALGFIVGFTMVFVVLGAFAGLMGGFLRRYQTVVNIVSGTAVIIFGLNYLGILNIRLLNRTRAGKQGSITGFFSSVLFGIVFSISWTPCVGTFLSSALILASQQGSMIQGIMMLLCYSLGLGVPFLLSAVLVERLKNAFALIKKHYEVVNMISGLLLIVIGILMITGTMGKLFSLLTF